MTCFMCKGAVREGFSTFTADTDDGVIIIKNVPARVCGQCGEVSYDDAVALRLEQIVDSVRHTAATEIAVVSYSQKAA